MGRVTRLPFVFAAAVAVALALYSCTDDPPITPPPPGEGDTLAVTVQDVSPTSVTLRLTVNSVGEYRLDRDGTTAWTGSITPPDTVIVDANLLPSTEYHYTLMHIVDGGAVSNSPVATARTSDTSSHEFLWEVDTLFFHGTNQPVYFDAKAFYGTSSSNVYMVGYTTGGDEMCWKWDGHEWDNLDISRYVGRDVADVDGLDSSYIVFLSFDQGHPTIPTASGIVAMDNGVLTPLPLPLGTNWRSCIAVVSRNEVYLGGVDGIQRFDGTRWEWMLDTTDQVIDANGREFMAMDVYKHLDGTLEMTSMRTVYPKPTKYYLWRWQAGRFAVADTFSSGEKVISRVHFGYTFYDNGTDVLSGSSGGIFKWIGNEWVKISPESAVLVAGNENDLYTTNWATVRHFNGSTWHDIKAELAVKYPDIMSQLQSVYSLYYQQGVFFLVLRVNNMTVIFRGKQV